MERKCLILLLCLTGVTIILTATPPVFAQLGYRPGPSGYFKCWACRGRGVDSQGNPCTYCGGSRVRNIHQMRQGSSYVGYRGYRNPGSSCFVATAAYGTPWQKNVVKLQRFRDRYLLTNPLGKRFVAFYYSHGPLLANAIRNRPWARFVTRMALTPCVVVAGAATGNTEDLFILGALLLIATFVATTAIKKIAKTIRQPETTEITG